MLKVGAPLDVVVLISEEPVSKLATVYISAGQRIKEGTTANREAGVGVVLSAVASGKIARVVTHGIVSGVICISSVLPGDRLACANSDGPGLASGAGKVVPVNTITPTGTVAAPKINLITGALQSGNAGLALMVSGADSALQFPGGAASGITGVQIPAFTGSGFYTARVIGKALTSGGFGSGIVMLVSLAG